MTIDEARQHIGDTVIYRPYAPDLDPAEQGVITSVSDRFAFVRYGHDVASKATSPELLGPPDTPDACPESKMDDGSHSGELDGGCSWCGASAAELEESHG